jgi:hypothetical protein
LRKGLVLRRTNQSNKITLKEGSKNSRKRATATFKGREAANFRDAPLYYEWHEKAYLGAAHGYSGILFLLLTAAKYVTEEDLKTRVRPTIDYMMKLRFVSGNYPSSLDNRADKLVHWCHGAPGFVFLFCKAGFLSRFSRVCAQLLTLSSDELILAYSSRNESKNSRRKPDTEHRL